MSAPGTFQVLLIGDNHETYAHIDHLLRGSIANHWVLHGCGSFSEAAQRLGGRDYDVVLVDEQLTVRSDSSAIRQLVKPGLARRSKSTCRKLLAR